MRNYAGSRKGICSYNLMQNFLVQLLRLKSSVFMVIFLNAFWYGNEVIPKGSSQNEVVPLLIVFHLPYSKHWGVKKLLLVSPLKSKIFTCVALVSNSCRSYSTHVALISFVQHLCRTHVTLLSHSYHFLVTLLSHSCRTHVARAQQWCCKLDQIFNYYLCLNQATCLVTWQLKLVFLLVTNMQL